MKTSRQNAKAQTAEQIAEQATIWEAKLNGTYKSGAMTANVEVAPMSEETVTPEMLAKVGQVLTYTDEDGVQRVTRSGATLANL